MAAQAAHIGAHKHNRRFLRAAEGIGLTTRIGIDVIDEQWMALGDIGGSHLDLLERQLLILQRAIAPNDDETPQGFLPF